MDLCSFVTVISCIVIVAAAEVSVLEDSLSWLDARSACRARGEQGSCDLITRDRVTEEWPNLGLSGVESFWVGGQRFYQWLWNVDGRPSLPLLESVGCYGATVDGGDVIRMDFNGPYQCLSYCNINKLVYLQGLQCHCSRDRKGEMVSRDRCDVTCNGINETCGGVNEYFSVYRLPGQIEFEEADLEWKCAIGRVTGTFSDYSLQIQATNCERYHHYFCLSDLQTDKVPQRLEKFETAVSRCHSEAKGNSSLPTLTEFNRTGQLVSDYKLLLDKLGISDYAFWLPLQRHVWAAWVDGQEGEQGGQPGSCLAATPRSGDYRLDDLPCTDKQRAICQCTNGADSDSSGTSDAEKAAQNAKLKRIAIIIVVATLLLVFVSVAVFFFLRRRRSRSGADFDKPQLNNPVYRG